MYHAWYMSLIINERSQPTTNELIIMMGKPRKVTRFYPPTPVRAYLS